MSVDYGGLASRLTALENALSRLVLPSKPRRSVGTYPPAYFGAATSGVTTYNAQAGAYERVGNIIFFTAFVSWSAATGTGAALLSLPFTAANVTNQYFAVAVENDSVTFANGSVQGLIAPNTAYVQFISPISNAGGTQLTVEAAGGLVATGFYFVD